MRFKLYYKVNGSRHIVTGDRLDNMPEFNEGDVKRMRGMFVGERADFNFNTISVQRVSDHKPTEVEENA